MIHAHHLCGVLLLGVVHHHRATPLLCVASSRLSTYDLRRAIRKKSNSALFSKLGSSRGGRWELNSRDSSVGGMVQEPVLITVNAGSNPHTVTFSEEISSVSQCIQHHVKKRVKNTPLAQWKDLSLSVVDPRWIGCTSCLGGGAAGAGKTPGPCVE